MTYYIYNPNAGKVLAEKEIPQTNGADVTVYETRGVGDATEYTRQICTEAKAHGEHIHIHIFGGDGSICECVCGIMAAEAGEIVTLTAHPCGTGNDFVRYFGEEEKDKPRKIDIMRLDLPNEKETAYGINMINIGFDCAAAAKTSEIKKKLPVSGLLAYVFGVLGVLFKPLGQKMKLTWEDENGEIHTREDKFLLCAICNAAYCGGGFRAAPCASLTDGLLDVLMVDVISRLDFIRIVGAYHAGTHVLPDGTVNPKYDKIIRYIKCKNIEIEGMEAVCLDGEIRNTAKARVSIMEDALTYLPQ